MRIRTLAPAAAFSMMAGWACLSAALAKTTIRMLRVEQNPDVVAYWNDIARRFEAKQPGVKGEVQYLENEAYKTKLTTLL